ncbi:MAG: GNAT family N-acetyltransferase [Bacteroidales bacterium]|nr:GNAT family N-acetyltransferase [Bacteroidales bacterium]
MVATDDFQILKAEQEDLEEILYIQKCCYLSEAAIYNDYTIPPLKQNLSDIEADFRNQSILKLVLNNKIVGSVRGYVKEDTCYVGKLIVNKEYQNMGFGAKLIREIENMFAGVSRFELFTGFKSDKNLYLYKKLGYREFKNEELNDFTLTYLEKNVGSNR